MYILWILLQHDVHHPHKVYLVTADASVNFYQPVGSNDDHWNLPVAIAGVDFCTELDVVHEENPY